ncbi:hypothetical protein, partial [Pseudomonas viridiflava]|uniref:hypothetical protein n=2 Tax=Pseudomonas viridiflava TaxID=33069 RepID=UPI00197DA963
GGVPFVREKAGTSDAYAVAETLHSRTSPLPRRPVFDARQRYVEDVVAPPTVRGRSASAWVGGTRHQDTADFSSHKSPLVLPAGRFSRSVLVPAC